MYERNEIFIEQLTEVIHKELILIKSLLISKKDMREKIFSNIGNENKERILILNQCFKKILVWIFFI